MNDDVDVLVRKYDDGMISRRQLLIGIAALTGANGGSAAAADSTAFEGKSLNHVTLSVSDVERSTGFYRSILGVSIISEQKNGVNLGLGDSFLGIYAIKESPRVNHFCIGLDEFRVQVAAERLKQFGITPTVRKDKPEVYFKDPDGITVQLEHKDYRG